MVNPMLTQGDWHGKEGIGAFTSSQQAYNTLYIGSAAQAKRFQEKSRETGKTKKTSQKSKSRTRIS